MPDLPPVFLVSNSSVRYVTLSVILQHSTILFSIKIRSPFKDNKLNTGQASVSLTFISFMRSFSLVHTFLPF